MGEKKEGKLMDNLFKLPILKKLKNVKHIEIIVCIIFISLLLLIYFINFSPQSKSTKTSTSVSTGEISLTSSSAYAKLLEEKLTGVIGELKGVKNVQVMVSISSGGEVVIANNVEEKTIENGDGKNVTVVKTPIIVTENGTSKPIVLMEILPQVDGVVVVASGAEDAFVRLNILKAVEAIIKIPSENIQVFAGK
ncbi:MAG: hypothetical protein ACI4TI_03205 [Christensenellales bacterium]